MDGAELLVDHPSEEHAFEAAAGDAPFGAARNPADVEVTEEIAARGVHARDVGRRRLGRGRAVPDEEGVALAAVRFRLRRSHLQPAHRLGCRILPRVRLADFERAVVAGAEDIRARVVDGNDGCARQNVEPFFVRVHVRRERSARCELGDAQTGVHGSAGVVHEARFGVSLVVARVAALIAQRGGVELAVVMHTRVRSSGDCMLDSAAAGGPRGVHLVACLFRFSTGRSVVAAGRSQSTPRVITTAFAYTVH